MKKIIAIVGSATLALGVAGTVPSLATPARPAATAAATAKAYKPPAIKWGACSNATLKAAKAQCGFLVVPMDYYKPKGAKIKIAVSRKLHTSDAAHYQGAMFVNPGGPGGSGLIYSVLQGAIPNKVGFDYDWYGFDPRGVGSSVPSLSCNPNFFHGDRPPYHPYTRRIHNQWVSRSKAYAKDCATAKNHALFNHVRTTDSVADMESLRTAIGKKYINYYGFSYGTYLGSVYATLHPKRVRRFVFDSTVDPRKVFYRSNLDQDVAFQKTFDIYFHWLAKYHAVYHVGATYKQVRSLYLSTVRRLDRHAAHKILGGDELIDVFTSAGYYVYGWEDIAKAYSKFINKGRPHDLIAMYTDANPTTPGGDNSYAMYLATQCTDAHWPRSQAKLDRDSRRLNKKYNYFTWSNAWFNGPCAYWKFNGRYSPVDVTGKHVKSKILMIDETYDAATPYPGSIYVRRIFPTASLIEGRNGTTHAGTLSGVACTDNTIATYLATGVTPKRRSGNRSDKVCRPVPKPNPTAKTPSALRTANPALVKMRDVAATSRG